ncbi:MAG: relaxase/mobilization nuclease domain-containing protein [Saprospiraceae bacterium]
MILKNLTRRSNTGQLVNYLFKQEKDNKLKPIIKHNLRSRTTKGWTKELDKNFELRLNRRKDSIRLHHTIISFSNKDKKQINLDLLKDITKKYIELRGKDNIYLASSHHDKEHIHLHIVMSATKYMTGETNRISKSEFKGLKLALDAFQKEKYPELSHSLPNHGKSQKIQLTEQEHQLQSWEGKLSQKQQILETVEAVYSKSKSLDDFLSQLKSEGYEPYYRAGNLYGVEDGGRNFRFKTLGFDKDKLDELNKQPDNAEKELHEIRNLRESKSDEKEQEEKCERSIDDDDSDEETEDDTDDSDYDGLGL